jgi:hypothetical protein
MGLNSDALVREVLSSQAQFGHFSWQNSSFLALSQRECLKYSTTDGVVNRPVVAVNFQIFYSSSSSLKREVALAVGATAGVINGAARALV